jgi:uncharacterized Tic20 family protein
MKVILFAISLAGLFTSVYFFYKDSSNGYIQSHLIYLALLITLFLNSLLGIIITWPWKKDKKNVAK